MVSAIIIYPCHTESRFANFDAVNYSTPFHQQVSNVVDLRIWLDARVFETGPSCESVIRYPLKPPKFTYACYRCERTVFFEALVGVETMLIAQVVVTLRYVFFRDGSVITTTE